MVFPKLGLLNILTCFRQPYVSFKFHFPTNIINGKQIITPRNNGVAEIIIKFNRQWQHLCGGVLIHPRWVLTAAHSFFNPLEPNKLIAPYQAYRVCFGSVDLMSGVRYTIKNIQHANYEGTPDKKFVFNDIALIELDGHVPEELSKSVPLATNPYESYSGKTGEIYGWGATSSLCHGKVSMDQVYSPKLLSGRVLIEKNDRCKDIVCRVDEKRICINYDLSSSMACKGDSGGPLILKNADNQDILIGISSYGDLRCQEWDVYTRVTSYLDWISQVTKLKL